MTPPRDLLSLYPRTWRRRYEAEFRQLLADRPPSLRDRLDIVAGAIDARLNPHVPGEEARELLPPDARTTRGMAVAAGVMFSVWAAVGLSFVDRWGSGVEPPPFAATTAGVTGWIGAFLGLIVMVRIALAYDHVIGPSGAAGAVMLATGQIASALGMGVFGLLLLVVGALIFSSRAAGHVVSGRVAAAFGLLVVATAVGMSAFAMSGGQELTWLWAVLAMGPAWVLLGVGLRAPGHASGPVQASPSAT